MQLAVRPALITGVGVAGAAMIALSPVAAPLPVSHQPALTELQSTAVALTAGFNPLDEWARALQTASADATRIADVYFQAPEAALQQILVNASNHLTDILQNPRSIGSVLGQIQHNLQTAINTSVVVGADAATQKKALAASVDSLHSLALTMLPSFMNLDPQGLTVVKNVMNFMASPLSGVLVGLAGPALSPVVALGQSIQSIIGHLTNGTPDFGAALRDFVNIPAHMVGAFLNGATVNLSGLAPLINKSGVLKEGTTMNSLHLALGGLFSTGSTQNGIGGSIFNSLTMNVTTKALGFPFTLNIAGKPVGPLAALTALSQAIAKALGWNGTGNPLANLKLPTTTTSAAAAASTPAATKLSITTTASDNSVTSIPKVAALTTKKTATTSAETAPEKAATEHTDTKVATAETTKGDPKAETNSTDSQKKSSPTTDSAGPSTSTGTSQSGTDAAADKNPAKAHDHGKARDKSATTGKTHDSGKSGHAKHSGKHPAAHRSANKHK